MFVGEENEKHGMQKPLKFKGQFRIKKPTAYLDNLILRSC